MSKRILSIVFFVSIAALAGYGVYKKFTQKQKDTASPQAVVATASKTQTSSFFADKYYGVFLDTGDVYFGKLSNKEGVFVTVEDAFYLKVTQITEKDKSGKQTGASAPNMSLVKVGSEIHKPKNKIEIQRSHIIYIQELEQDSDVIRAINDYQYQLSRPQGQ